MSVSLSTSSIHGGAQVGARSSFGATQNYKFVLFVVVFFFLFFSFFCRRSHVEGGTRCVVETFVQLHTSAIRWNPRQSNPDRHAYWLETASSHAPLPHSPKSTKYNPLSLVFPLRNLCEQLIFDNVVPISGPIIVVQCKVKQKMCCKVIRVAFFFFFK